MPLVHISLRAGKPEPYRQAIFDSLYRAIREALGVPEDPEVAMGAGMFAAMLALGVWAAWPIGAIILGIAALLTRGRLMVLEQPAPPER